MRIDYQIGWWNGLQGEVHSKKMDQLMQSIYTLVHTFVIIIIIFFTKE